MRWAGNGYERDYRAVAGLDRCARGGVKKKDAESDYLRAQLNELVTERANQHNFVNDGLNNIRKMIVEYGRVLQELQLKEAKKGLDLEPALIIQMQDLHTKIQELRQKLKNSETRTDYLIGQILE